MSIEARKQRIATVAKWGLGMVAALVVAPIIFMVVKGLIGLAVAGIVGLAIINFAPVVGMKFANWKLKAIKAEATRNPVETMQSVYAEKDNAIKALAQRIEDFATEVRNFDDKLVGFKTEFPTEAPKFEATLGAMRELLARRRQRLADARQELGRFEGEIRKANAIWKMGLAAASMHRAAGMAEDTLLQRIKTETAVDSVQTSLNRALSQLETSLAEEAPQLEHQPANVIELAPQAVKVRA